MLSDGGFLLEFIIFALVTCITPGPNNLMLTYSGVNFGFRKSVPHMLGIMIGFPPMLLLVGVGANWLFLGTWLRQSLQVAGCLYLLWLAYQISVSGPPGTKAHRTKPFSLLQAAGFQWVNGKAWVMALGAISTYTTAKGHYFFEVLAMSAVFALIGFGCNAIWTLSGTILGKWLGTPKWLRVFNVVMATLLLISLAPILMELSHLVRY